MRFIAQYWWAWSLGIVVFGAATILGAISNANRTMRNFQQRDDSLETAADNTSNNTQGFFFFALMTLASSAMLVISIAAILINTIIGLRFEIRLYETPLCGGILC